MTRKGITSYRRRVHSLTSCNAAPTAKRGFKRGRWEYFVLSEQLLLNRFFYSDSQSMKKEKKIATDKDMQCMHACDYGMEMSFFPFFGGRGSEGGNFVIIFCSF